MMTIKKLPKYPLALAARAGGAGETGSDARYTWTGRTVETC